MKIRNVWLGLKDQMPLRRFFKNLFGGHIFRKFKVRSHLRDDGRPKVMYNTQVSAKKAADSMERKYGKHYSYYKCFHCDGYHVGGNGVPGVRTVL